VNTIAIQTGLHIMQARLVACRARKHRRDDESNAAQRLGHFSLPALAGHNSRRCRRVSKFNMDAPISAAWVHSYRGRPLNAAAASLHPCQSIVVALMNLKAIIAISVAAAVPECAQAQKPWVTKDDKAKTQTYCEIQNLGEQMERAYEKRNLKLVDELLQNIDALEKTLGPEYVALMDRLEDIDLEKEKIGVEIMLVFDALDRLCPR
jgi:hypothetical protein